ncbi:MAG: LysR family transcriptional regulator, partial [Clostridia bacterium]|nr:LysR family transcriptional regulator [Clostridia bacterium]
LGISIVSRRAVEEELVLGTLAGVYLEGISLRRDLYLVHKKDKRLRPAERKLLAFLKEDLCLS